MRYFESLELAQVQSGINPEAVTNALFIDVFWEGVNQSSKLMYQVDGFHAYDPLEQAVTEVTLRKDLNNANEFTDTSFYQLSADNGFATKPLGAVNELLTYESVMEVAQGQAMPFLMGRPTYIRVAALISSPISANMEGIEALAWPFLQSDPNLASGPMWLTAFVDPTTSDAFVCLFSAREGQLFFSMAMKLPIGLLMAPALSSGTIFAGWGWYIVKFLLIVALVAALISMWPAAGLGATAAVLAGCASTLLSAIAVVIDWIREATASAQPSQAWRAKKQAAEAKIEAAKAKAIAAREQGDMDKLKEAYEDHRDATKEYRDLFNEPESESGLDADESKFVQSGLNEVIKGLDEALETWR
ncbi:MAG: hypothetical protein AAGA38_13390 [Pseudomonadota bacterium]